MTHFEFVSVAASLVYALVLARLLHGLPHVLRLERRYWVHAGWVIQVLLMTVLSWWGIWAFREVHLTPLGFLSLLSLPAFLYLRAVLIVPDAPQGIRSWRDYFFGIFRCRWVQRCVPWRPCHRERDRADRVLDRRP
jgi:hypothetical protein